MKSSKYSDENELKLRREIRCKPIINEKKKKKKGDCVEKIGRKRKENGMDEEIRRLAWHRRLRVSVGLEGPCGDVHSCLSHSFSISFYA